MDLMQPEFPDHAERAKPHESAPEAATREGLAELLRDSPIPQAELIDNLALYLPRRPMMDLLSLHHLYRKILTVPGVVMEFGVRWGRHLATLTALRALYEPYNVHRRILGFDTFAGFPSVSPIDQANRHAIPGGLTVTADYEQHLEQVIAAHEAVEPLGHIRRTLWLTGDARKTLPRYLDDNPQTVIALAYFDLDLHEPTRDVLSAVLPYLSCGSILAFDQVGHPKWPGETVALREVLNLAHLRLQVIPGFPSPVFTRWAGPPGSGNRL